MIQMIAIKTLR